MSYLFLETCDVRPSDLGRNSVAAHSVRLPVETLCVLVLSFAILRGELQDYPVRGDFRSIRSGPWNATLTWERFDGAAWIAADRCPDSSAGIISVRAGHSVTIGSTLVYDQVVVERDGQVTVVASVNHTLADGPGIDLTIDGTWLNQGSSWTILGSARWIVNDGGVYIHNTTAGIATPISKSSLSRSSTFIYRGGSALNPSSTFSGRTYGHLSLESSGGSFTLSASGSGALVISGDLTIGPGARWNTSAFSGSITIGGTTSIAGEWGGSGTGNQGVHTFDGPFRLEAGGKYSLATTGSAQGALMFKGDIVCLSALTTPRNRLIEFRGPNRQTIDAPARFILSNGAMARHRLMISAASILELGSQQNLVLHGELDLSGTIMGSSSSSCVLRSDSSQSVVISGSVLIPVRFDSTSADRRITGSGIWNAILVEKGSPLHVSGSHTMMGESAPLQVADTAVFEKGSVVTYRGQSRQILSPQVYSGLVIDNPQGVCLAGGTIVDGRLTMRNGALSTGLHSLMLGPSGTIEENGENKIHGSIGAVRLLAAGKLEDFGGIGIKIRSDPVPPHDITVIRRTDTAWAIARSRPIRRSFTLAPTANLRAATIVLRCDSSDLNGALESALQLYGSADGGAHWSRLGGTVDTSTHTLSYVGDCTSQLITLAEPCQTPIITSVSPNVVEQGSVVDLRISGSGFMEGVSSFSVSGNGVQVNSLMVRSNTSLVANLSVDVAAPLGERDLYLETAGGETRSTSVFEVVKARNPVPQLTSVAPSTGARLESLAVTFHGSGFVEGVTIASFGEGIAVITYVLDPTLLVAYASIAEAASPGFRNASVVNSAPGGGVAVLGEAFSVINPMPRITSLSPRNAARGEYVGISVTGANFISGVTSLDLGDGIALDSVRVVSHDLITARIRAEFSAARGARPVAVRNQAPGGGSNALTDGLIVTDPPPRITNVSVAIIPRGAYRSVDISGTGFVSKGMILNFGSGIAVDSVSVIDSCRIRALLIASRSAQPGPRDIILANCGPDGESSLLRGALAVVNPLPTITSVDPPFAVRGQTLAVSLAGSDMFSDATSLDFGPGVRVNSCTSDSTGGRLISSMSVTYDAAVGLRDVRVKNLPPGGGEAVLLSSFAIINPAPSALSIKPSSGGRGGSLDITLSGTSFIRGGTSVSLSPGVTTDSVEILSPSLMRARISISQTAIVGARTVVVTNPPPGGGVSRLMHVFNVENAPPAVEGVEPKIVVRGERSTLAVRGSGFCPGITTVDVGPGFVVESTKVVSPSVIEVGLLVKASAELGTRDVHVTNPRPGGGEAEMQNAFAVHNPSPQIAAVDPPLGVSGKVLSLKITGRGFLQGVTTLSFGDDIEVDTLAVRNSTEMEARMTIHAVTRAGPRSVTVSNPGPGGGTASLRDGFLVTVPSSADIDGAPIPDKPVLVGVYPNPFNRAVTVVYGVPEGCSVRIKLRNILGVEIAEIAREDQRPGYHTVRWASTREPSGVYFVHMVVEFDTSGKRFTTSRKVILLK